MIDLYVVVLFLFVVAVIFYTSNKTNKALMYIMFEIQEHNRVYIESITPVIPAPALQTVPERSVEEIKRDVLGGGING